MTKFKNSNLIVLNLYCKKKVKKIQIFNKLKNQIVAKLKNSQVVTKLTKFSFDKSKTSNCDKTQKHIFWQNWKTKYLQLKISNCDKTQFMTKLQKSLLVTTTLHLGMFCYLAMFFWDTIYVLAHKFYPWSVTSFQST